MAGMGGLHILGTERHEARRIDLQLRGRCGRQGDPGSSRFYLSLEDDLMRIFAGEWVKNILTRLGMEEGEAIESRMVSRRIEGAQKKVEERNFEIRKNLLEYDEVMDEQRKRAYSYRQQILDGADCKQLILAMIRQQVDHYLDQFLAKDYGTETFAQWAGKQLGVELEARDFRGMDFHVGRELRQASRPSGWPKAKCWKPSRRTCPRRSTPPNGTGRPWPRRSTSAGGCNFRDRDLKKVGREEVGEFLIERPGRRSQRSIWPTARATSIPISACRRPAAG